MWKVSDSRVVFQVTVKGNDKTVITGGYVEVKPASVTVTSTASTVNKSAQQPGTSKDTGAELKAAAVFDSLAKTITSEVVSDVAAMFLFKIKGADGKVYKYTVDLRDMATSGVVNGVPQDGAKADCTIAMKDDDFALLAQGKLNGMQAFMSGKLKVSGNVMLAQKLSAVFSNTKSKL
eukprot:m.79850 g.79850  ORF g.79850 m.79850 type:complete len:177 (+) comp12582_c0_seq2:2225-2755(+)